MPEWNIQPRAHACQSCGHAFQKGEPLHTLLFDARPGYQRLDVCEGCWQTQHAQGSNHRRGFISHWVSRYEPPPPAPPEPIQKETAESLLRKLVALNAPEYAGSVFILAVMLERKRVLKVKVRLAGADRPVWIYEHARTGEVFTVTDPQLRLDQLDTVQREAARLLEHGLPAHPESAAPGAGSEPASDQPTSEPAPESLAAAVPDLEPPAPETAQSRADS